jgi:hypothetical protein
MSKSCNVVGGCIFFLYQRQVFQKMYTHKSGNFIFEKLTCIYSLQYTPSITKNYNNNNNNNVMRPLHKVNEHPKCIDSLCLCPLGLRSFFRIYPIFTHLNAITLPCVGIDFKYMIVGYSKNMLNLKYLPYKWGNQKNNWPSRVCIYYLP